MCLMIQLAGTYFTCTDKENHLYEIRFCKKRNVIRLLMSSLLPHVLKCARTYIYYKKIINAMNYYYYYR